MKCHFIKARDLPDAWFQAVDLCYKEGRDYEVVEGSYAGSQFRRELDYVTVHIEHPHTQPLLPEIPVGLGIPNPVPEGMDYIERYLPYLLTEKREPNEAYTYGSRLFSSTHFQFDEISMEFKQVGGNDSIRVMQPVESKGHPALSQVEEVIAKFKRGFGNNQACMTIAEPSDIHLTDPPCLRQIDCRVFPLGESEDTEQLHFFIYFRSWDLWGGFPANLAALVHLQQYMAECIGIEPGEMVCSSKGLHLYSMYWELAQIRLGEKYAR